MNESTPERTTKFNCPNHCRSYAWIPSHYNKLCDDLQVDQSLGPDLALSGMYYGHHPSCSEYPFQEPGREEREAEEVRRLEKTLDGLLKKKQAEALAFEKAAVVHLDRLELAET